MNKKILYLIIFIISINFIYAGDCNLDLLTEQTIAFYVGNETSITYYNDVGISNFNLNNGQSPDRTSEFWGYGMDFDQPNNEYIYSDTTSLIELDEFTIGFWYRTENPNDHQVMFSSYITAPSTEGCYFQMRDSGELRMDCYNNGVRDRTASNELISFNTDYYLIGIVNKTDYSRIFYNNTEITYSVSDANNFAYSAGNHRIILSRDRVGGGQYVNGVMGNVIILNTSSINASCRGILQNSTYPFNATSPDVTAPVLNFYYLEDIGTNKYYDVPLHWRNLIKIVANITEDNTVSSCYINDSNFTLLSLSDTQVIFNATSPLITEGNHSVTINCTDNSGNTGYLSFSFTEDRTNPFMILNSPLNNSIYDKSNTSSISFDVNYYDLWLYQANTTILYPNGSIFKNYSYNNIIDVWLNITDTLYTVNMTTGIYTIRHLVSDEHTNNNFNEILDFTEIENEKNKKLIYHLSKGDIEYTYPLDIDIETLSVFDRWKQKFNYNGKIIDEIEIEIEADKLVYLENSIYPCHLILYDYYWYDCKGLNVGSNLTVEIEDNKAKFKFYPTNTDYDISESIGGLNFLNTTTFFEINFTTLSRGFNITSIDVNIRTEEQNNFILLFLIWIFMIILAFFRKDLTILIISSIFGFFLGLWSFNNMEGISTLISALITAFSVYLAYMGVKNYKE